MKFCDVLRVLRIELGLTQMELANALNISFATVSRWELEKTFPARSMLAVVYDFAYKHGVSEECANNLREAMANTKLEKLNLANGNIYAIEHSSLGQLVDESAFPIYVCDMESDEVLYVNKKAVEIIGSDLSKSKSKKCYKYIMHRDSPCTFCHKNKLVNDHFICHDVYSPFYNKLYHTQGKLIQWNGHKAHVHYIFEMDNTVHIDIQKEKEDNYNKQLYFKTQVIGDSVAAVHYNLSKNKIINVMCVDPSWSDIVKTSPVDDITSFLKHNITIPEKVEKFKNICRVESLIEMYYSGKIHFSIKHFLSKHPGYYESTLDLIQNPITDDIEVFFVLRNITDSVLTSEVLEKLVSIDYESVAIIDIKTKRVRQYCGDSIPDIIAEQNRLHNTIEGVEAYMRKNCIDEDIERVVKETSLPYVIEQLKILPFISTCYSLKQD